jgi:tRNA(adenine34) deaminase
MDGILINHEKWMTEAFREAEKAFREKEVPVGAVVVLENRIIGRGHNRVEALKDATAHAEILAITAASNTISSWRLDQAFLYVTLEPCSMCAGAVINARISRIVYGTKDPRAGACGSVYNLPEDPKSVFHVDITSGLLEEKCSSILHTFFRLKREN